MDQSTLVAQGHELLELLDKANIAIKVALWFHNADVDSWKLWLVPVGNLANNKHEFYRRMSEVITPNKAALGGLDVSDTELIVDKHPVIMALAGAFRVSGQSSMSINQSMMNGFYIPEAIVIRYEI